MRPIFFVGFSHPDIQIASAIFLRNRLRFSPFYEKILKYSRNMALEIINDDPALIKDKNDILKVFNAFYYPGAKLQRL